MYYKKIKHINLSDGTEKSTLPKRFQTRYGARLEIIGQPMY